MRVTALRWVAFMQLEAAVRALPLSRAATERSQPPGD